MLLRSRVVSLLSCSWHCPWFCAMDSLYALSVVFLVPSLQRRFYPSQTSFVRMVETFVWVSAYLPHLFRHTEDVQMFWKEARQLGSWGTGDSPSPDGARWHCFIKQTREQASGRHGVLRLRHQLGLFIRRWRHLPCLSASCNQRGAHTTDLVCCQAFIQSTPQMLTVPSLAVVQLIARCDSSWKTLSRAAGRMTVTGSMLGT